MLACCIAWHMSAFSLQQCENSCLVVRALLQRCAMGKQLNREWFVLPDRFCKICRAIVSERAAGANAIVGNDEGYSREFMLCSFNSLTDWMLEDLADGRKEGIISVDVGSHLMACVKCY